MVKTLVHGAQKAGRYTIAWNATNDAGFKVSSGMYFYQMKVDGKPLETRKMVLMK